MSTKTAYTLAAILALAISTASADVSVVQNGYFEVIVGSQVVSQHASYRKALESAINHNGTEATIQQPQITVKKDVRDVTLSWKPPQQRENGERLEPEEIAGYRLTASREGEEDRQIETDKTDLVVGIPVGEWTFAVQSKDTDGLDSRHSEPVIITNTGELVR